VGLLRVITAVILTGAAAGARYQAFDDGALGFNCELPAGYRVERLGPAAGVVADVASFTWPEGEYAGVGIVASARPAGEGLYLLALNDARARGEAADYELAVVPFTPAAIEKSGADEGFAVTYTESGLLPADTRRHDIIYFSAGPRRIMVDVSYLNGVADRCQEIAAHIVDTIVIRTAEKAGAPAGEPPAAKE